MKFFPLTQNFGFFFGGKKRYTKTAVPNNLNQILSGTPQWLNPEQWDAYNVFMTTPQLYAVISRKGSLMANGLWKHYRVGKDGMPEQIENSPVVSMLENPNPLMSGNDYIKSLNESMCVFGNSYEYKLKGFSGQDIPSMMYILPAGQIELKTTGKWYKQSDISEIIEYYKYCAGAITDRLETSDIIHRRIINSANPIIGESPMKALYMPITNIRTAYDFRNVIMSKHGALGILSNTSASSDGAIPLTKEERGRLETAYQESYGLDDEQSKLIISNASLQYQSMSFPTRDLLLFEEVDANFKTIIDAYGLNDNLFSKSQGATFENQAAGIKQAYQSTIIPEAEELAMNRSQELGLIEKKEWLELDYSHIEVLQENEKEKAEVMEKKANTISKLQESLMFTNEEIKDILNF